MIFLAGELVTPDLSMALLDRAEPHLTGPKAAGRSGGGGGFRVQVQVHGYLLGCPLRESFSVLKELQGPVVRKPQVRQAY